MNELLNKLPEGFAEVSKKRILEVDTLQTRLNVAVPEIINEMQEIRVKLYHLIMDSDGFAGGLPQMIATYNALAHAQVEMEKARLV